MQNDMELNAEGPSCVVDGSCRGAADIEANQAGASCTLDPSQMPDRIERWRRVLGYLEDRHVTSSEAVFEFRATVELKTDLEELVKLERICCAHVSWLLVQTPDVVCLRLKADGGSLRSILDALPEFSEDHS